MVVLRYCQVLTLLVLLLPCVSAQSADEMDIDRAVEIALSKHAALQAAAAMIRSSSGLERQAELRPNPVLSLQTENWRAWGTPAFSVASDLDLYAFVSQPLEARGKRDRRIELASQETRIAELESRALEWKIRQDVRQAFLRALSAQKQLEIVKENGQYLEQVVEYHRIRVELGAMAEADLIRVQLERDRLRIFEDTAAADAERARTELLKAMGVTGFNPDFRILDKRETAAPTAPPLTIQQLLARAHSNRAEVLMADAGIDRARAQARLQRAQARPDWNVIVGYKRTMDYNTVLGGVAVPLPFLNRNQGNILHSEVEIERSESLRQAVVAAIEADIQSALVSVRRRRATLREMEKGVLDRAEESLRISLAAYQEGGADLLRLLDAQRVRNEVKLLYTRAEMEYRLSFAELEGAVGEENIMLSEDLLRVTP